MECQGNVGAGNCDAKRAEAKPMGAGEDGIDCDATCAEAKLKGTGEDGIDCDATRVEAKLKGTGEDGIDCDATCAEAKLKGAGGDGIDCDATCVEAKLKAASETVSAAIKLYRSHAKRQKKELETARENARRLKFQGDDWKSKYIELREENSRLRGMERGMQEESRRKPAATHAADLPSAKAREGKNKGATEEMASFIQSATSTQSELRAYFYFLLDASGGDRPIECETGGTGVPSAGAEGLGEQKSALRKGIALNIELRARLAVSGLPREITLPDPKLISGRVKLEPDYLARIRADAELLLGAR